MLIFNGKKYFVPLFGVVGAEGADALPSQVVEGAKFVGANGVVETGTMKTMDSGDLIVSGAKIMTPAGYYPDGAEETVATVDRASTTMAISLENENGRMRLTASNNQQKGYTDGGNKTASQYVSLSVTKPVIGANGDVTAIARMSAGADNMIMRESSKLSLGANTADNLTVNGAEITVPKGYYPNEVKKSVASVAMATPTVLVDADEEESEIIITSVNNQQTGYAEAPVAPYQPPFTHTFVALEISGATATMSCGDVSISKSVATVDRASTSISSSVDSVRERLNFTASNNQAAGYTVGGEKTASRYATLTVNTPTIDASGNVRAVATIADGSDTSKSISKTSSPLQLGANTADNLTVNGAEITAGAGYYPNAVKKSVATTTLAKPTIGINRENRKITARVSQSAGYVSQKVETAELDFPSYLIDTNGIIKTSSDLVVNGDEIITPAGYYPDQVSAFVKTGSLGEILASANNATGIVNMQVSNTEGYIPQGKKTATLKLENDYLIPANIKKDVTIFGVKGTMESGASINTCTVNVTFSTNAGITQISATTFANGAISTVNHHFMNNNSGQSVSIPNVVCGSALSINASKMVSLYCSGSKNEHYSLLGGTITVPNTSGTYSVEIGVVDD